MKKSNLVVAVILLVSAVLFSSGVYKKISGFDRGGAGKKVIAVIPKGTASMWWEVVHKGAIAAGDELGY